MKAPGSFFAILVVVISAHLAIPSVAEQTLSTFSVPGELEEHIFEFSNPGSDHVNITLPRWTQITSATLDVSGFNYVGENPSGIVVDLEGTTIWNSSDDAYGDMGFQSVFTDSSSETLVSMGPLNNYSENATVLLPKNAHVTDVEMRINGSQKPLDILIAMATAVPIGDFDDVVSKLEPYGGPEMRSASRHDLRDSHDEDPSLEKLQLYDLVLGFGDGSFLKKDEYGDNLTLFVDDGGGVVLAMGSLRLDEGNNPAGTFYSLDYSPIHPGTAETGGTTDAGLIHQENHPIMLGVVEPNVTSNGRISTLR